MKQHFLLENSNKKR
jgi:hypothetical protein